MAPAGRHNWVAALAWFAALFALGVVVFGAFVRLSDAGLSCPDWPTCYGQATWPQLSGQVAHADQLFQRPVEVHKVWREQVHRMLAGTLGVLVLALALIATWRKPRCRWGVAIATLAASAGTILYMAVDEHVVSTLLGAAAIVLPLIVAARLTRTGPWRATVVALALIILQAMLGMWTVTWKLLPIVVTSHLLGGMSIFAVMAWVALRFSRVGAWGDEFRSVRRFVGVGIVLLALQIFLGGWTSSNYAAMACGVGDVAFPHCLGRWWPPANYHEGFVLWRGVGDLWRGAMTDFEHGVLASPARTAIQMVHRIGAAVIFVYLGWLAWKLARVGLRGFGLAIAGMLVVQILLGISNVYFALPLPVAMAHNGGAALLLFTLVTALARTQKRLPSPVAGA